MKLLIYPEIDDLRLNKLTDRFPGLTLVPARTL